MAVLKRKKKVIKGAPRKKGGKLLGPSFDGWETWTGAAFNRFRNNAHAFYYEEFKPSELLSSVWSWMKANNYTSDQIKKAKAATVPNDINVSISILCKLLEDGCPDINPSHEEYWSAMPGCSGELKPLTHYIKQSVDNAVEHGVVAVEDNVEQEEVKTQTTRPNIQERIQEQAINAVSEIDNWIDSFAENTKEFNLSGINIGSELTKNGVTQAHARKIIAFYQKEAEDYRDYINLPTTAQISKMEETEQDKFIQLKEAYSHFSKSDITKIIKAYDAVIDACNMIIESSNATRKTRKPKQRSAAKVIEKLKYKKQDDKYSVVSINPAEIVGASELWVFNTKTRKLGKYVAATIDPTGMARDGTGLSVKGTTIIGFNEEASVQKTLRKPEVALKEFKAAGKVALRTFLDDINAVDTKMNGRCNPDTVLLKVN